LKTRAWVAAGLTAFTMFFLLAAHGTADRVLELVGIPRIDSVGGVAIEVCASPEDRAQMEEHLHAAGYETRFVEGTTCDDIEVPEGEPARIEALFAPRARLALREVLDDRGPDFGDDARYVTSDEGALDESAVASARFVVDEQNQPAVMVSLTPAGRAAFRALTARVVGKQVAIIVDGHVMSTPRVTHAIDSDVMQIALGEHGTEAEGVRLASALGSGGGLPAGAEGFMLHSRAPRAAAALIGARVVLALIAGFIVLLIGRRLASTRLVHDPLPVPIGPPQPGLATRVAITGACMALPLVLRLVPLPGISGLDEAPFTLATLSLPLLLIAFFLVELVALMAPSLRARRHAGPAARAPLTLATMVVAAALYAIPIITTLTYLRQGEAFGALALSMPLVIVGMVGGLALQLGAAQVVSRFGLGSGLATIYLADLITQLVATTVRSPLAIEPALASLGLLLLVMTATILLLHTRVAESRHRLPLGGSLAAQVGVVVASLVMLLALVAPELPQVWTRLPLGVHVLVVLFFGVVFALGTTRPTAPRELLTAIASTLVWLVALTVLDAAGVLPVAFAAYSVAIVAAFVLDLVHEAKARRAHPDLVVVWPFHDIPRAEAAAEDLRRRGLAVAFRGFYLHALLRAYGAWVPAQLMVPRAQLAAAQDALVSEPARAVVTAALDAL